MINATPDLSEGALYLLEEVLLGATTGVSLWPRHEAAAEELIKMGILQKKLAIVAGGFQNLYTVTSEGRAFQKLLGAR